MTRDSGAQPRIVPKDPSEWDAPFMAALRTQVPPKTARAEGEPRPAARTSNMLGIFAWNAPLTQGYFGLSTHLFHSTLSDRVRELVTVRVGWVRRSEYEWAQHVRMARNAGVTDAEISALADGPAVDWAPLEAAAVAAVDEICADRYVSDDTWERLSEHFDVQELMDLVFTIGAYDLLAMAMNTFGLELDPGAEGFPA